MSRYTQGNVLSISYDIWISGNKLGIEKKQCINDVQINETVDGADTCTITISDPEFLFIEDNIFIEDNTIKVNIGWSGVTYRVTFEGYISAVDIEFPNDGVPKLTITCMDNTHLMNREKKNNTYKDATSAEVIQKIVQQYGYQCQIESGYAFERQETITQSEQTDIEFITRLAGDEVYPFTARLVGNTFQYVKKGHLTDPVMELTYLKYPHEIISFSPKINKETVKKEIKSSKVKNKAIDSSTITSSKTSDSKKSSGGSSSGSDSGYTYNPKTKKWNRK